MSFEKINQRIDNRLKELNTIDKSIIDNRLELTLKLQTMLNDISLDNRFVVHALKHLAEGKLISIAEYCQEKASIHKGKAFVKICNNEIHNVVNNSNNV